MESITKNIFPANFFNYNECDPTTQSCQDNQQKDNYISAALTAAFFAAPSVLRWMLGPVSDDLLAPQALFIFAKHLEDEGLMKGRQDIIVQAIGKMLRAAQLYETYGDSKKAGEAYLEISQLFEKPYLKNRDGASIVVDLFKTLANNVSNHDNVVAGARSGNKLQLIMPIGNLSKDPIVSAAWLAYARAIPFEQDRLPQIYQTAIQILAFSNIPKEAADAYVVDLVLRCVGSGDFAMANKFLELVKGQSEEMHRIIDALNMYEFAKLANSDTASEKIYGVARLTLLVTEKLPRAFNEYYSGIFLFNIAHSLGQNSVHGVIAGLLLLRAAEKRMNELDLASYKNHPYGPEYYLQKIEAAKMRREATLADIGIKPATINEQVIQSPVPTGSKVKAKSGKVKPSVIVPIPPLVLDVGLEPSARANREGRVGKRLGRLIELFRRK